MAGGWAVFIKNLLIIQVVCYSTYYTILCQFKQNDYVLDFERADTKWQDNDNVRDLKIRTFKYNRTTTCVNASGIFTKDFNTGMRVQVQALKFLSNEYRLFPLRFEFNFCESIQKDDFGLAGFYNCGNFSKCPLKKGGFVLCNWGPDASRFPPRIPFGRYLINLTVIFQVKEIMVLELYIHIKEKPLY